MTGLDLIGKCSTLCLINKIAFEIFINNTDHILLNKEYLNKLQTVPYTQWNTNSNYLLSDSPVTDH